ncbi:class I SAM-dependent methyltransferase [Paenalcaligenes sp. Me131]|uniref:class I SAM-dependent methyltransferase n=1 Tax=Paenalcaligenes sp. Me131 TaxID=3392636 RepID=UPI003D2832FA
MTTPSIGLLYQKVTELQAQTPWGNVLDAGTGLGSMRWLQSIDSSSWTAITGAEGMARQIRQSPIFHAREQDRLLVDNWMNAELLANEQFDTVLADYLLGAIEGFAPYWQDQLFPRLRQLARGNLYVIGLSPYVPYDADHDAGKLVTEIGRLRDACLLLADERPYREYPLEWVLRQLRHANFKPVDVQQFGIRYGANFVNGQLDMCAARTQRFKDRGLALAMSEHIADLRQRALNYVAQEGGLRHGFDYVIQAQAM